MDDAALVGEVERLGNLPGEPERLGLGQTPVDAIGERLSFDELQDESADTGILDYFFERYLADAAACPIEFGDWVETVYDPAELHRTFHASHWANRLVDGVLRRE